MIVAPAGSRRGASSAGTRRARSTTLVRTIPLILVIVAEAAWISVVAGLVQEYALSEPTLGIVAFCGFVAAGVVAVKLFGVRLGRRWPPVAVALMAVAGSIGWLASAEARTAVTEVGLGHALTVHPGGWLAAIAVFRGFAHARLPLAEQRLAGLLDIGIPGLAVAAIAGGMVAEPWRSRFLADALVAAIAFATSATLALAMARLTAIGAESGFDWRRNPAWVGLLVVIVAATAAVAIPASTLAASVGGSIIALLVGVSLGPFLVIGLLIGFDMRTVRVMAIFVGFAFALFGLLTVLGGRGQLAPTAGSVVGRSDAPSELGQAVVIVAALMVLAAIVAAVVIVRFWMRRVILTEDGVAETRMIDRGDAQRPSPRRKRRRAPTPVDAISAYIALDEELAGRVGLGRDPTETPAEHTRRLRAGGRRELALDLLAADYALARFGGIPLSPTEDRRAVARWRALRVRLRDQRR